MRRQRFSYSLPSLDDSSVPLDSESMSVISSLYSYPETVWSQIISPEPEALIPYYIYPFPCYEMPYEQTTSIPCFFNPSITPCSLDGLDAINYSDDKCNLVNESICRNIPHGDIMIPEIFSPQNDSLTSDNVENLLPAIPTTYPLVTDYGVVTILLRHLIRIDISPKEAICVTNTPASCVAVINGIRGKSCIIHPNGRVLHDGKEIHMATLNHQAKMTNRGIVFTSKSLCLSYIVDASGTKTTAEKFKNLNHDFSLNVFYDSMTQNDVDECYKMVNESRYRSYWNGDEVWTLGGFRIKQDQMGDVKITRNGGDQYVIRSSPTTGQVTVKTFLVEMSIGRYPDNYFVVRKGDKKVTASLKGFTVQNGSQKAGINRSGEVALF